MGRGSNTRVTSQVAGRSVGTEINRLDSLSSEEYHTLETALKPKGSSRSGFIAADERLLDVIESDVRSLAAVGLTPQEVGTRLQDILQSIEIFGTISAASRKKYQIPDHIRALSFRISKGFQECPFSAKECGATCGHKDDPLPERDIHGGDDWRIENEKTGETIEGSGLIPHLAVCHSFFEGGVSQRVDPIKLARVLELI